MTVSENKLVARLRGKVGKRFTRFVGVAAASLAATEIALMLCDGAFHMTSTRAALVAWFTGAVVSYILSRWAWERKGRPDVLRETVPFWVISAMVLVILTLANKFAYHSAGWMHLTGAKHVLWVGFVWLCANFCTFILRFVIFHYVLFAGRAPLSAARAAATAEGGSAPEIHHGVPHPQSAHITDTRPAAANGSAVHTEAPTTNGPANAAAPAKRTTPAARNRPAAPLPPIGGE
jgi:putative flippase GtrA